MSFVADREWRIEAQRRREMYLDRIREVTEGFALRNRERLEDLVAQGLDTYVAEDYLRCRASLDRVERLLSRDPEQARDENIRLSASMRSLAYIARQNRRASQKAEQEAAQAAADAERDAARERMAAERDARADRVSQEETARDDFLEMIRKARRSLPGAVERDLCQPDLKALSDVIESSKFSLDELQQVRRELSERIASVTANALTKAEAIKLAQQRDEERSQMSAVLEDALLVYKRLSDDVAQTMIVNLQSSLADVTVTMQSLEDRLATIRQDADDRALRETARRHVVGGLLRELRNAGFIVSEPKLEGGEASAVVIKAQRPSGAQAAFRVNLDAMTYKFDHYQGQACLDDADKVMPRLQDIYGIELEEGRISWRNPDMIGKLEKRLPDNTGERRK